MKALVEILQERRGLTAAVFKDRYPFPVLLHRIKASDGINLSAETQFARPPSGGSSSIGGAMLSLGLANAKAVMHLTGVANSLGASGPQAITDGSIVVFSASTPPGPRGLCIGRASEAAFCLPYTKVSKAHAYLRERVGRWTLIDGGSRNGTQRNGALVPPDSPVELDDGDLLQLSQYQFLFYAPAGFYRILGD